MDRLKIIDETIQVIGINRGMNEETKQWVNNKDKYFEKGIAAPP